VTDRCDAQKIVARHRRLHGYEDATLKRAAANHAIRTKDLTR
jgi:hypothetical protein